jgi:hypothetical protein
MRVFRLLLHLYSKSFRGEYGREMCPFFARERMDARGPLSIAALWLHASADVAPNAARVHADILRRRAGRGDPRAPCVRGLHARAGDWRAARPRRADAHHRRHGVRQGLVLTTAGIVLGAAAAWGVRTVARAVAGGVSPSDVATFSAAVLLALVMTVIGGLLPAWRAARVDPMSALRMDGYAVVRGRGPGHASFSVPAPA